MKLEVGQFVRTNEGKITKLIEIDKDEFKRFDKLVDFTNYKINKASHNVIDLIEVGDYVNGELVLEKVLYGNNAGVKVFGDTYFDDEIQSIVTKEQFSAMEYKID